MVAIAHSGLAFLRPYGALWLLILAAVCFLRLPARLCHTASARHASEGPIGKPGDSCTLLLLKLTLLLSNAGEELVGARAYRVMFALVSLPLAIAAVVYFIDHRYDGIPLWNVR